ncbi:CPBP family intramembrane glutamic endopeptidase [Tsukamurella sp. NPDC003166]|uniref:CPBP family intramembrane glutamic endopeptidase n=1 Tax=Tsukamurella sp. NPDC003166 TaxID=3154444 RepID=UPI0033B8F241
MTVPEAAPRDRRPLRAEVAIVLTVTFAWSGLYSLVRLIGYQLGAGVGSTTVTLNPVRSPHAVIDFLLQVLGAVQLFGWAALALYLLVRSGIGFADIGLALRGPRAALARNIGLGTGLAALIGIPGLALYATGRALGVTASVVPASGDVQWWRILTYVLLAAGNAVAEEVVVVGYFMTRLRQLGMGRAGTVASSALLRGSYHLYQGFGAGLGNLVMGLVFGAAYDRWRRLWPLVIAHFLLDVVAFVGYALLRPHLGFLR